jgi:hypothetical protein
MNELLLRAIEQSRYTSLSLVDDLNDEELLKIAKPLDLHPAYILGHLDLFDAYVLSSVNDNPVKIDRASGLNLYGPHGAALQQKQLCREKSWYVNRLKDRINAYQNVLRSVSDQVFLRDNPHEELRPEFPKIGDLFAYVPCHESQHADDLANWRSLMGFKPLKARRFGP